MSISPLAIGGVAGGAAGALGSAAGGLGVPGRAQAPAWVRNSSLDVQREYAVGQAFEQMLVSTLAASLVRSGEGEGDAPGQQGSAGDASQNLMTSMVPQALAGAIATGKGLGIAEQLTRELIAKTPGAKVDLSGGTRA
jgi:Rod binding domain-containing protein